MTVPKHGDERTLYLVWEGVDHVSPQAVNAVWTVDDYFPEGVWRVTDHGFRATVPARDAEFSASDAIANYLEWQRRAVEHARVALELAELRLLSARRWQIAWVPRPVKP